MTYKITVNNFSQNNQQKCMLLKKQKYHLDSIKSKTQHISGDGSKRQHNRNFCYNVSGHDSPSKHVKYDGIENLILHSGIFK